MASNASRSRRNRRHGLHAVPAEHWDKGPDRLLIDAASRPTSRLASIAGRRRLLARHDGSAFRLTLSIPLKILQAGDARREYCAPAPRHSPSVHAVGLGRVRHGWRSASRSSRLGFSVLVVSDPPNDGTSQHERRPASFSLLAPPTSRSTASILKGKDVLARIAWKNTATARESERNFAKRCPRADQGVAKVADPLGIMIAGRLRRLGRRDRRPRRDAHKFTRDRSSSRRCRSSPDGEGPLAQDYDFTTFARSSRRQRRVPPRASRPAHADQHGESRLLHRRRARALRGLGFSARGTAWEGRPTAFRPRGLAARERTAGSSRSGTRSAPRGSG